MRFVVTVLLAISLAAVGTLAQANGSSVSADTEKKDNLKVARAFEEASCVVFGATPEQEALLRDQLRRMHPAVLPARVVFVPHWKYLDNVRVFQLHVPKGFSSVMFTHLASRTVFIDNDRYLGEEWLGYWMAHELGHLESNSAKEEDAERAAKKLRPALKLVQKVE